MTPAKWGLLALLGGALTSTAVVAAWDLASDPPFRSKGIERVAEGRAQAGAMSKSPVGTVAVAPQPTPHGARASLAEQLMERLLGLLEQAGQEDDTEEIARLRSELLGLGEGAAGPLLARLSSEQDTTRRDLLLDLLRSVPGHAAESYLIEQARSARAGSSRSIAMDALAERGSDQALQALADITATDPELPSRPLVVSERRGVADRSTELPDEVDYTPRMKAMVALAATEDDRAIPVLLRVLQREREESLRMRAVEHLRAWQSHGLVLPALRQAAAQDPSRYVRLAALHALDGADDAKLGELLSEIVERDPDAGVRLLAQRLLDRLSDARP
jgi:HEAT repeat protein